MSFDIRKVENTEVSSLAGLAKQIWKQHFPSIIGDKQVDYMVENFQSEKAIKSQINDGYTYYFLTVGGKNIGYFGIQPKDDGSLFLSKLYIKVSHRGNGYARKAFEFIKGIAKEQELNSIWLTVNKHNDNTIAIYKKFGMEITRQQVTDIGNGFVMDDYIFLYSL